MSPSMRRQVQASCDHEMIKILLSSNGSRQVQTPYEPERKATDNSPHLLGCDFFVLPPHPQRVQDILVHDKMVKYPTICEFSIDIL